MSVCLIVRDEQARLAGCLSAAHPFAAEVVVCDTGSRDRTAELAAAAGARVITTPWHDDFAAARNHALAACTGDWILSVDADEIVHGEPAWLHAMLTACGEELDALSVEIDNSSAPDVAAGSHRELKLFRRTVCRWVGRVHEQVARLDGLPLRSADLPNRTLHLEHHGYDDPDLARAKARRNAALAELDLTRLHDLDAADPVLARVALDVGRSHVGAGATP